MLARKLLEAAGNAGGESLYVEDVFSTYLYTGNGTSQTITNGIDLSGEGGLVWLKGRSGATDHALYDTVRGATKDLVSNSTAAETTQATGLTAFSDTGFSIGALAKLNTNTATYASWTFRKAEKFFDVVTYTGDGVAGRTVAHNLGSTPAFIIVKQTNASNGWPVYHASYGATYVQFLNDFTSAFTNTGYWNDTAPTDSVFTVGNQSRVNTSGGSYVAYLFASDAGGFGDDGSESIIKCGSFTTVGTTASVNCGFEPQWLLVKKRTTTSGWFLFDNMRGMPVKVNPNTLYANLNQAENTGQLTYVSPTAVGFDVSGNDWGVDSEYIYIAIRRPMKTPTSGTEVFYPTGNSLPSTIVTTGFPADMAMQFEGSGNNTHVSTKLLTGPTDATTLITSGNFSPGLSVTGWYPFYLSFLNPQTQAYFNYVGSSGTAGYAFKRAKGFFDLVAYTGTSTAHTENHNLGVVPELMFVKVTSTTNNWAVYAGNPNDYLILNRTNLTATSSTRWNNTAPTDSVFTVGTDSQVNGFSQNYIAYLFATLAGVSKVGSYTGTAATINVDCGFSAGARFVLIKRTDSTGGWYVWDSARGIVTGNDPYFLLNSTAAEVTNTDYIDPLSSGFTVTSSAPAALNASGGTYIFLAIA